MSRGGDFWSRRKAKVREAEETERAAEEAERLADELADREEKTDEEILAELELPDPESLNAGDDFTRFLSAAVPDRIRRKALRRLWLSNPVLANLDGLVDYADDYTDSATVIENLQTAYQVGKGMLARAERFADAGKSDSGGPESETDGIPTGIKQNMHMGSDTDVSQSEIPLTDDADWVQTGIREEGLAKPDNNDSFDEKIDDDRERRTVRPKGRMRFTYSKK